MGVATAVVILLGVVCLIVFYHLHRQRLGEYEVARRYEETGTDPAESGKDDNHGENEVIYDLVPSIRDSADEPNNQRPRPEGQTKRKVRFKINI